MDSSEFGENILFLKMFKPGGEKYTYLANLAPNDYWYVTGQEGRFTWEQLVEFFKQNNILGRESMYSIDSISPLFD